MLGFFGLILLGLVQGLTEFLPVSSSAHLAILHQILGARSVEAEVSFDVLLHLATLVAVLIYFRAYLAATATGLMHPGASGDTGTGQPALRTVLAVVAATVATGVVYAAFSLARLKTKEDVTDLRLIGLGLLVTGALLYSIQVALKRKRPAAQLTLLIAFGVGLGQGMALLPGISRSGATIVAGILLGLDQAVAARFSFLVAIPAILLAMAKHAKPLMHEVTTHSAALGLGYFAAAIVAGVVGYLSIGIIFRLIRALKLHTFAYYCWALGTCTLAWALLGGR